MSLTTEERARRQAEYEEIQERVYEQSVHEVLTLTAFLRTYHWLSSFNQKNDLSPSPTGGITLSNAMLRQIAYGFIHATHARPQTFLIHLQPHEFELLSILSPQGAWLEDDAVCVMFKALKYADYLIPPLMLSFKIKSPLVYEKIKDECDFMTFTLITRSQLTNNFTVREVCNPVVPMLKSAPNKDNHVKSFSRAFT